MSVVIYMLGPRYERTWCFADLVEMPKVPTGQNVCDAVLSALKRGVGFDPAGDDGDSNSDPALVSFMCDGGKNLTATSAARAR